MSSFFYTIDECGSDVEVLVSVKDKNLSKRMIYKDDLQGKVDKKLFLFFSRLSARGALNKIKISKKKLINFFELIQTDQTIFYEGKKLFFQMKGKKKFYLVVKDESEKGAVVEGHILLDRGKCLFQDCLFFSLRDPIFFLHENTLHVLDDFPLMRVFQKLTNGPSFFPKFNEEIKGEAISVRCEKKDLPIEPYLVLKDERGIFAELWMGYGLDVTVNFSDERTSLGSFLRRKKEEGYWEKDLLEAGYEKRGNEYYAASENSLKVLQFLLELGWKIKNLQNRSIFLMKDLKIEHQEKEEIYFSGKALFEEGEAGIEDLFQALEKKEAFISLSKGIGLLDPKICKECMKILPWMEKKEKKFILHKSRIGLIKDYSIKKPSEKIFLQEKEYFHGNLHPFQKIGVEWLKKTSFGLLADEMGLGKTVQILAFFAHLGKKAPVLIVAPSFLLFNWEREFKTFLPEFHMYVHRGKDRKQNLSECNYILTSYALLRRDFQLFKNRNFSCMVLDESSYIKNSDSQTFDTVSQIQAEKRICLNGTPIENRFDDLWSQFYYLNPQLLPEKKRFLEIIHENSASLKKIMSPFLLKRTKKEVSLELPEKIEQTIWVEMLEEEKAVYDKYFEIAKEKAQKTDKKLEILEVILRLRQLVCHSSLLKNSDISCPSSKLRQLLLDVKSLEGTGSKILIFSQFVQMLKILKQEIPESLCLDGSLSMIRRQEIVDVFQNDPDQRVLLLSLKAAGVGLNLTKADYVFLYDPWWNPSVEDQAIARAHRMGQKNTVFVRRYLTKKSIEEKLDILKKQKLQYQSFLDATEFNLEDLFHLLN